MPPKDSGGHGQHFALRHVGLQLAIAGGMQAIEGDIAGGDVAFQGAAGDVGFSAAFQAAVHDQLILHFAPGQPAQGGVAAMEAHEQIRHAR